MHLHITAVYRRYSFSIGFYVFRIGSDIVLIESFDLSITTYLHKLDIHSLGRKTYFHKILCNDISAQR